MTTRPPAEVGMSIEEVDTPALLIDLDAFEANLERMRAAIAGKPVRLRPHAKTHKCPAIALRQMELGAVGVCCQKVSEAEAMVEGGVDDVLVSNQIVGEAKVRRLAALATRARVGACVDDPAHVTALSAAAKREGAELEVLVEVNVGANRCGVEPGEAVVRLARQVSEAEGLRFGGLQAYHGSAQHIRGHGERAAAIASAVAIVSETVEALGSAGLACPTISGAGTGTFPFETASGVYTELQAGSYIFMDADYAANQDAGGGPFREFAHSLFVWTTVMSHPVAGRAVVDAGLKASSVDSGLPRVLGREGVTYSGASDEHGKLDVASSAAPLAIGDKLRLIPGHCDPTVNLYDWYVGVRGGKVELLWPITARGAVL